MKGEGEPEFERNDGCFADGQVLDAAPPPYRARHHPATNEVIEKHIETITRRHLEGKTLQSDVDNFYILLDVYDSLPLRPDALQDRANWDALDPLAPLG